MWGEFKDTGSGAARERLSSTTPAGQVVAGCLGAGLPQSLEQADLVSNGMFGLMEPWRSSIPAAR